jgi:hypothetical protein
MYPQKKEDLHIKTLFFWSFPFFGRGEYRLIGKSPKSCVTARVTLFELESSINSTWSGMKFVDATEKEMNQHTKSLGLCERTVFRLGRLSELTKSNGGKSKERNHSSATHSV